MKHRTSFLAMTLLVTASMLLAACGGTPTPAPAAPPAATQPPAPTQAPAATKAPAQAPAVELVYFHPAYGPDFDGWHQKVIDAFNEKNKGQIHVTLTNVDEETYKTKLLIDVRSSTPPDIFFNWEGAKAKMMIDAGFAEPLDKYYQQYGWDKTLTPSAVNLATFGGKKYFVGYGMAAMVYFYRPDIFEKYNIAVPKTWDELMAVAETLKKNKVAPDILPNLNKWPAQFDWENWLVSKYGPEVLQDLFDNKIPWTDPRSVEAFAALKDLAGNGYFYPGVNSLDLTPSVIPMGKGEVAMTFGGSWMVKRFLDDKTKQPLFPVDFFVFPPMGDRKPVLQAFPDLTLMIHAKSPHKDEAAKFVDFFLSKETQASFTELNFEFPANVNVDVTAVKAVPPLGAKIYKAMVEAGQYTFMPVDHAIDPAISNEYLDALQAVLAGGMTPQQAAAATEAEAVKVRGAVK